MNSILIATILGATASLAPITKDGVTLRFIEFEEFCQSLAQGVEIDIVNEQDVLVMCDVQLVLQRADSRGFFSEVKRGEIKQVKMNPRSRRGFRVAEPLTFGSFRVNYDVKVDQRMFASGRLNFEASGPYRISLVDPYFLTSEAVLVRVEKLIPVENEEDFSDLGRNEHYRFRLLDSTGQRVLSQTEQYLSDRIQPYSHRRIVEALISTKGQPPGDYQVSVEIIEGKNPFKKVAHLLYPIKKGVEGL